MKFQKRLHIRKSDMVRYYNTTHFKMKEKKSIENFVEEDKESVEFSDKKLHIYHNFEFDLLKVIQFLTFVIGLYFGATNFLYFYAFMILFYKPNCELK